MTISKEMFYVNQTIGNSTAAGVIFGVLVGGAGA